MSDKDIFDDKDQNKDDLIDDKNKDQETLETLLSEIKNEDGSQKYKDVAEVIKAYTHAQSHIKTLEEENATLRTKGDSSEKLDELLKTIKESKGSGQGDKDTSTMKPEDVLGIVKDFFNETKNAETEASNIEKVASAFKAKYGKDASEKLYGGASDLGFSRTEINSMIAKNPNAVLKMLGVTVTKKDNIDPTTMKSLQNAGEFRDKPEEKPVSVMDISSSKELTEAFNASKQRTLKRLGLAE